MDSCSGGSLDIEGGLTLSTEKKVAKIAVLGEKKKVKKLCKLALAKEPEVRAAVATALGPIKQDEAFNTLVDLVRNGDINVRKAAVMALGVNGRKAGAEHIRNIMTQEANASIVPVCQEAIAQIIASDER